MQDRAANAGSSDSHGVPAGLRFEAASDYDGDLFLVLVEPSDVDPSSWVVQLRRRNGEVEDLGAPDRASNFGYQPTYNGLWIWYLADRSRDVTITIPGVEPFSPWDPPR